MTEHKSGSFNFLGVVLLLVLGGLIVYAFQTMRVQTSQPAHAATPPVGGGASLHELAGAGGGTLAGALASASPEAINAPISEGPGVQRWRLGMTPLMCAAYEGDAAGVKALVDKGAKTESRAADGRTALIYAAGWGDAEKVKALVEARANLEARAEKGFTALMFAAARGPAANVKALLDAGARVDERNNFRQTALMLAVRSGDGEKVAMLLANNADVNARDEDGLSPLMFAAESEAPATLLDVLIKAGAKLNEGDEEGLTSLMRAAYRADAEKVRVLLAGGADPSIKDGKGQTAADWAATLDADKGREVAEMLKGK